MRYRDLQSNTLKQKIISIVFELSDEFLQGINKKAMINTDNFKHMLAENSLTFLSTEDESLFRLIVYFKFVQALAEQCAHFNSENGQHFTDIAREFEQEAKLLREQVKQLLKRKSATLLAHRNVLMNWLDSTFSRKDLRLVNENTCVWNQHLIAYTLNQWKTLYTVWSLKEWKTANIFSRKFWRK